MLKGLKSVSRPSHLGQLAREITVQNCQQQPQLSQPATPSMLLPWAKAVCKLRSPRPRAFPAPRWCLEASPDLPGTLCLRGSPALECLIIT